MKQTSVGMEVLVNIPESERAGNPVAKYHGQTMTVKTRKSCRHGTQAYYELEGAESEYGVPYSFAKEWLVAL